jgi:nitrate reductase gamma subunit
MIDKIFYFITVPMVYFAVAWCIAWIVVKVLGIFRAPKTPPTLRIFPEGKDPEDWNTGGLPGAILDAFGMSSLRTNKPLLWTFLALFHIGLVLLILSHLDLFPQINIMSPDSANMLGDGGVGLVLTILLLYLLFRRFRTPVREISVPADYLLLFLLFLLFISGDVISWGNSWTQSGFGLGKADFGVYLNNLIRFTWADPAVELDHPHYSIMVVHVLLANLFLLVLPFSKIMHTFFAVPMTKLRRG